MKFKKYFIVVMILVAMASCGGNQMKNVIVRADSLLESQPNSARTALAMLDSLKPKKPTMPKSLQMYYEFVYAKGMNKGFVNFTTDSVMKLVVDYYDAHGSANERMEAHYLLGCVYRDLQNAPATLACYNRAVESADTMRKDSNYDLLAIIYGQLGYLQYQQEMPKFALESLEKAKRYAQVCKDTVLYLQAISCQGIAYYKIGDKRKYLECMDYLFHRYTKLGMKQDASLVLCSTIYEYVNSSRLAKAKQLMDLYEKKAGLIDGKGYVAKGKEVYYATKGEYYLKTHQVDSALLMYRRLLKSTCLIDEKEKAYRGLMLSYQIKSQLDSVAKYAILDQASTDSTFHEMSTNTLIKMQSLYNYEQTERKNNELVILNHDLKSRNKMVLVLFLLGGIFTYIYYRQRIMKRELELKLQADQLRLKQNQYVLDNQELEELKNQLESGKQLEEKLRKEYEGRITQLQKRILVFEESSTLEKRNNINEILRKSEIRIILDKKAVKGECMTEDELAEVKSLLKVQTPSFYALVHDTELLSEKQLALCLLVRLGFSSSDIQHLLDISSGYASNAKKTISKKMFGKEMQQKNFEEKIHQML